MTLDQCEGMNVAIEDSRLTHTRLGLEMSMPIIMCGYVCHSFGSSFHSSTGGVEGDDCVAMSRSMEDEACKQVLMESLASYM